MLKRIPRVVKEQKNQSIWSKHLVSICSFTAIPGNLSAWESSESLTQWVCPHYIPLHPEKLADMLIIILQSAFHIPVFQCWMGSRALKDHFTLRIAWVLERELKRVGLMASRKLQATWDPPLVLLPWSFDWQLQFCNCVVPLPAEATLALSLQERREGLSVTKPAFVLHFLALTTTDVPFTSQSQRTSFKLFLL